MQVKHGQGSWPIGERVSSWITVALASEKCEHFLGDKCCRHPDQLPPHPTRPHTGTKKHEQTDMQWHTQTYIQRDRQGHEKRMLPPSSSATTSYDQIQLDHTRRCGSRILQQWVSNPYERGTRGWARKAPRGVGSGEEAVLWEKTLTFKYVLFKKRHPNQKGGCPNTLDTPWIRPWRDKYIKIHTQPHKDMQMAQMALKHVVIYIRQ